MLSRRELLAGAAALTLSQSLSFAQAAPRPWLGIHLLLNNDRATRDLIAEVPALAKMGFNVLIAEVGYSFEFDSHPELRGGGFITKKMAGELAAACRQNKVRLIPQFNCLGHQSWSKTTFSLLTRHPEFDETPGQFPENKGIYCRSWCPRHPEVNPIVFALMDDLLKAFEADAMHVGLDEVFLISSQHCQRCKGTDPAETFALAVKDYHAHLVGKRKVEMLMWADRLIDGKKTGFGEWEGATNGTHPAIDMVAKDIVMCDWHYGKRKEYPSIPLFIEKGYRVWPCGWDKVDATEALIDAGQKHAGPKMLGHMCTTWGKVRPGNLATWEPIVAASKRFAK